MTTTARTTILAVLLTSLCQVGFADEGSLVIQCSGYDLLTPTKAFASEEEQETTSSPKLYARLVAETDLNREETAFRCSFVVPVDYDTTGDPPSIHFFGWVPPGQSAGILGCTQPNDLSWEVHWRRYEGGDATALGEAQTETTNTAALGCEACGGAWCFEDEEFVEFTSDLTDEAVNMSVGDLIVLRVDRTDDQDAYLEDFYVWLQAVEIRYPRS